MITLTLTEKQLRRLVDGAVRDAVRTHPYYLTFSGKRSLMSSVSKRVTGTIQGFAAQAARGRDSAATEAGTLQSRLNENVSATT